MAPVRRGICPGQLRRRRLEVPEQVVHVVGQREVGVHDIEHRQGKQAAIQRPVARACSQAQQSWRDDHDSSGSGLQAVGCLRQPCHCI